MNSAQQCRDTCGEPHGSVCTAIGDIKEDIKEIKGDIKTIVDNRNTARNMLISNSIAAAGVIIAAISIMVTFMKEGSNHGNSTEIHYPQSKNYVEDHQGYSAGDTGDVHLRGGNERDFRVNGGQ